MNIKTAILTTASSWFYPYAIKFCNTLSELGMKVQIYDNHENINESHEVIFILSYFRIIEPEFLNKHKFNLVVHESDLPKGIGWAPYFWQVLEGKLKIPIVLFEASDKADEGRIYFKDYIDLEGHELHDDLRRLQAEKTIDLCLKFIEVYPRVKSYEQTGTPTYYGKRSPKNSELDINKTIEEQFNLLRIVNNNNFPAFFIRNGKKYKLLIEEVKEPHTT